MASPELRAGPAAILFAAIAAFALWPSIASLWETWRTLHDYQHGFIVAAVSIAWLGRVAWLERARAVQPSLTGALALAALLFAWVVGFTANSQIVHQLLLPACLWAAVWAAAGWPMARRAFAPIGFLYFATPMWDYAVPVLQRLSVAATETALGWLGVHAIVKEFTVTIPAGTFQIIEGCSGKRYFMVTLALATLSVAVNHLRGLRAIGYLALCGALALVANWIRIVIVIYAGDRFGMQTYLVAVEHFTLGNVIFGVLLVAVFVIARALSHRGPPRAPPAPAASPSPARPRHASWVALPVAMLLGVYSVTWARTSPIDGGLPPGALPIATGQWQGPLPGDPRWSPHYVGAAGERRAAYVAVTGAAQGRVELYVNSYGKQRQGRELVQYANTLLAPGKWDRAWPPDSEALAGAAPLASFEARADNGSLWLLAYTFDVAGQQTSHEALAQLSYGLRSIRRPAPAGIVALAVPCDHNCGAARALARAFWDDMSGVVLGMLPMGRRGQ